MPAPRLWPTIASDARDNAADASVASLRALQPLITGRKITDVDTLQRLAIIGNNLQYIARQMESVGAKTKPVSEDFWCISNLRGS
jgi:hypothetical protein